MDEANLDSIEDLQDTSLITQSNNVNVNNPFLISTIPSANQSKEITSQNFSIDLLFNSNIESSTVLPISSKNPFANPSPYDPFVTDVSSTSSAKVAENDSFTDISKTDQNKLSSSPFTTESFLPKVTSSHSAPTNIVPPTSSDAQAIASTTSKSVENDQFLDWFTQSDDFTSGVDPTKNNINTTKTAEDPFASFYRQPQILSTLRMYYKFFYLFIHSNVYFRRKFSRKCFITTIYSF
jgi:hypothetical protein